MNSTKHDCLSSRETLNKLTVNQIPLSQENSLAIILSSHSQNTNLTKINFHPKFTAKLNLFYQHISSSKSLRKFCQEGNFSDAILKSTTVMTLHAISIPKLLWNHMEVKKHQLRILFLFLFSLFKMLVHNLKIHQQWQHIWWNYKPAHLSSRSNIPSGLHDNHTSANLKTTSFLQVDLQVPFSAQDFHVQKTVKYQHDLIIKPAIQKVHVKQKHTRL